MGWETVIQAGATIYGGITKLNEARTQAKAETEEGRLLAENKARDTVREAGRLQSSFLSSGLTLEGTPTEVLKRSYQYGTEDINQIAKNANARSKNIMTKARTQMLEGFNGLLDGVSTGGSVLDDLRITDAPTKAPTSMGPFWGASENVWASINNPVNSGFY